jgi:SAM-dependent methyltransferase
MGIKSWVLAALRLPVLQPLALRLLKQRADLHNEVHPFDRAHGVDTSGWVPAQYLFGDRDASRATMYAGCVPSAVQTALGVIPNLAGATFLDLGCGKGRALIAARGFPFAALHGIELSPALAAMAEANAALVASRTPGPPVTIAVGDASAPSLPAGDCVVFLYHPFGRELIDQLVGQLTVQVLARPWRTFIVYENPVHFAAFDGAGAFQRFYAAQIPYAA